MNTDATAEGVILDPGTGSIVHIQACDHEQWFQMTIGFVAALSTIAATLSYVFNPALASNKTFQFLVIAVVWWALTSSTSRA